ncbi:MAG: AAA family ATPase [Oscillospiraceae bacterium]|nr:AAA family ATPase [Oscillospiraceae bacterium]
MKIYKMTATFGKLQNETLALEPGLNILTHPNEWGKSTWCAFLVAMLYGVDTKERTTKDTLAVKEQYAPWSGVPMSGSMDICWEGRNITLQRSSTPKTPMGNFRAFETDSGLPVPELTAGNCGEMLLGVDKNVFLRTGFLRLSDLPVTDDAALRNRLNALVTTGDESGAEGLLVENLKELRNKCRHNKTGLLPQAEAQRDSLLDKIRKIDTLTSQKEVLSAQIDQLYQEKEALNNHLAHLSYARSQREYTHLHTAQKETKTLRNQVAELEKEVAALPSEKETRYKKAALSDLQQAISALQEKVLPDAPEPPVPHPAFAGLSAEGAVTRARQDVHALETLSRPTSPVFLLLGLGVLALGIVLGFINLILTFPCLFLSGLFLSMHLRNRQGQKKDREALCRLYGDLPPDRWVSTAEEYLRALYVYEKELSACRNAESEHLREKAIISARLNDLTLGKPISEALASWDSQLRLWETLTQKETALYQAESHAETLRAVLKPVPAPETEDTLFYTEEETRIHLSRVESSLAGAENQLQQLSGQLGLLGEKETYDRELSAVSQRISALEEHYAALTLALETAQTASENLQRRFAPAISKEAEKLFASLTGGRYEKLLLSRDFTVETSAADETTLHSSRFRSDGTVDQLYLALRLAVSKTLSPAAPLVLDDALVRFDDVRLKAALTLLREEAKNKQVLLFTCKS